MGDPYQQQQLNPFGKRHMKYEEGDGGSPWKAMKRLRVTTTPIFPGTPPTPTPSGFDGSAASTPAFHLLKDHQQQQQLIQPMFPKLYERFPLRQQQAGQDTMSDDWSATPPSCAKHHHHQQLSQSTSTPSPSSSMNADDVDYQSVNNILGALHLGRMQREQQQHGETIAERDEDVPHYFLQNAAHTHSNWGDTISTPPPLPASSSMLLSNTSTSSRSNESWYTRSTGPPPKPTKRKVVTHLATNSKLGWCFEWKSVVLDDSWIRLYSKETLATHVVRDKIQ